jgi:hypothetical protein
MVARNKGELLKMLEKELMAAMNEASDKSLKDLQKATKSFYSIESATQRNGGGYRRTGALKDTPRVTPVKNNGLSVSFKAYLDTEHQYTTGVNPNMQQVLELANYGKAFPTPNGYARDTNGQKLFWERGKLWIEEDFKKIMNKHFPK